MTTIAYKNGELWADSLVVHGATKCGTCQKIFSLAREFEVIVLDHKRKRVYTYSHSTQEELFDADFIAIGSGANLAMGAMAAGASAKKAIKIATQYDIYTGGELQNAQL
jgi:ATP-dependent protease HslVU (ClpYQ) peptidase subunit